MAFKSDRQRKAVMAKLTRGKLISNIPLVIVRKGTPFKEIKSGRTTTGVFIKGKFWSNAAGLTKKGLVLSEKKIRLRGKTFTRQFN